MTPREVFLEFEAARLRRRDEAERDASLAWQVVAILFRSLHDKRVPKLDTLLGRGHGRQPREVQRAMLQELSVRYGIPLRIKES